MPSAHIDSEPQGPTTPGARLRRARKRRRWSQRRLIAELERIARINGMMLPTPDSLKTMISRWERDRKVPDSRNRRLLCQALDISEAELGLPLDDLDL
jgi:transcriptional regulator with XRE-family HTH domain